MRTFTAYLDESADSKVYAVSGFVARNEIWNSFSSDWQTELNIPPKISHFKMHGVFRSTTNGVFKNYPVEKRIAKTESLISVINKHLPTKNDLAVNVVMDFQAYQSMLEPILPKTYRNPYLWCFQGILVGCSSWMSATAPGQKIDFIFDDNKKDFRDALLLYQRVANLPALRRIQRRGRYC